MAHHHLLILQCLFHKNCTYPVESRTYAFRVVFVFMLLCVLVLLLLPFLFCFANYVPSVVCCVLLSQRLCTWPAIKGDLVDVAAATATKGSNIRPQDLEWHLERHSAGLCWTWIHCSMLLRAAVVKVAAPSDAVLVLQ